MKLAWFCGKCFFGDTAERENGEFPKKEVNSKIDLRDDGRYDVICENGHPNIIILQEEKFEILFAIASMAILDGYYREAIANFAASVERLYEFFIKVIMDHHAVSDLEFNKVWKLVDCQSERQLGTFYFLYLMEFGKSPVVQNIAEKHLKFRNKVIHKGYIPQENEVMEYGEYLLSHMNDIIKQLKTKYPEAVSRVRTNRMCKLQKEGDNNIMSITIPSIISLSNGEKDYGTKSFKEELKKFMKRNDRTFTSK